MVNGFIDFFLYVARSVHLQNVNTTENSTQLINNFRIHWTFYCLRQKLWFIFVSEHIHITLFNRILISYAQISAAQNEEMSKVYEKRII